MTFENLLLLVPMLAAAAAGLVSAGRRNAQPARVVVKKQIKR